MATFSYIRCFAMSRPQCLTITKNDFSAYINNEQILGFSEGQTDETSYITMTDGTIYHIHKSLADLMGEFGKIQYTV